MKDRAFWNVLSIVKIVLCFLLAAAASISAQTVPLRVFCWNIHHGVGEDGKLDLERIAKVIRDARPDVVTLQEVDKQCDRSGKVDQCAELAKLTGMTGVFGKAMDLGSGEYGQAILSRHPIKSSKVHRLPGKGEPRIAIEALVSIDGVETKVIGCHLGLDGAERLAQAETLAKNLAEDSVPLILCGDFNEGPGSPTLKAFEKLLNPVPKKSPVLTCPAGKPDVEIDHFLVRGFTPVAPLSVLPEAVASDHRPLLVELIRK
jgi:endonuclease/exonuclease/phosphatase family metal-dependent hydrolase